jgi:lipopolysaccharide/colanic/teichoic acid biosynthesis glycosyltransferase
MGLSAVKLASVKQKRSVREAGEESSSRASRETLPVSFFSEPVFLRTLYLERKRAERSGKLFVLMLLDFEKLAQGENGGALARKAISSVVSSIRETDSPGWFKDNRVLGIVFAELGGASRQSILTALNAKIIASLHRALTPGQMEHIRLSFYCFPEDSEENNTGAGKVSPLYPDLVEREEVRKVTLGIKRAIDILGSSVALIVLSPVFLAIAIAIKLTSPGPVLFRQERFGRYGKTFTFLKFRSMYSSNDPRIHMEYVKQFIAGKAETKSSESEEHGVYKITRDPRVTGIGHFLRRTSLDELPQFINVLKGEMSLVGPRPPLAYEIEAYNVWHRRRLLEAKPGITGLWQVSGRSRLRFDDMVRLDLHYAKTWSVWLDIKILLQTPRAVFSGKGAY